MAQRMTRHMAWQWFEHPLTNAQTGEKGELVCINTATGLLAMAAAGTATLRPIGTLDNGSGVTTGNGVTKVRVKLFDEIKIHWFANDLAGTPVVAADVGSLCYLHDADSVTGDSVGNAPAGRVWGLSTQYGVGVEMIGFDAS